MASVTILVKLMSFPSKLMVNFYDILIDFSGNEDLRNTVAMAHSCILIESTVSP